MYYLTKKLEVAGAHKLTLPYESNGAVDPVPYKIKIDWEVK